MGMRRWWRGLIRRVSEGRKGERRSGLWCSKHSFTI